MLRQLLRDRGLTYRSLADRVGCSYVTVSNLINGHAALTREMAVRIAYALSAAPLVQGTTVVDPDLVEAFSIVDPDALSPTGKRADAGGAAKQVA